jgi:hypothetical protein
MMKRIQLMKKGLHNEHTQRVLQDITHPKKRLAGSVVKKLHGNYSRLKLKYGIDFHSLEKAGVTTPMMIKMGMPINEIIVGRLLQREGLRKLLNEVLNLSHLRTPEYRKLNFKALTHHGISLQTLLEHHVPLGILVREFADKELIQEGVSLEKIKEIKRVQNAHPTIFGLPKKR